MRFIVLFLLFSTIFSVQIQAQKSITVVIDAGHGGKDPGHESQNPNHLQEKELNLLIANYLGDYIEKYLQNVKVIYTRTDDSYPSLEDRIHVANSSKADYFISIHCNGSDYKTTRGTESHVHSMSASKSVGLAREIEKQFSTRAGRYSRGVKNDEDRAHSLQVLKYTQMTSVLVECGFLTNVSEANYLNTTQGQEVLASAIFRGFRTFIQAEHPTIDFIKSTSTKEKTKSGRYSIQLMSSIEPLEVNSDYFKKMPDKVERITLNTSKAYKYIYRMGDYSSQEKAKEELEFVKKNGFKDAYIVQR